MSNKTMIKGIIFIMFLFFIPATGAVTVTQTEYDTGDILNSLTTLDVILSDVNDSYDYTIFGHVGRTFNNGEIDGHFGIAGEFFHRDVTDAGTYTFTLDNDNFPFEGLAMDINISVRGYYPSNHSYVPGETSNHLSTITFGTSLSHREYHLMFRNHDPEQLTYSDIANKDGTTVETAMIRYDNQTGEYFSATPIYDLFVSDDSLYMFAASANLIDSSPGYLFDTYNYTYLDDYSIVYHGLDTHILKIRNKNYDYNESYTVFYGIRASEMTWSWWQLGDTISTLNPAYIDNVKITTDDSISIALFSLDSRENKCYIGLDHEKNYKYIGVACTFDVVEFSKSGYAIPEQFVPGTLGVIAQDYGNSIGMPFFPLLMVFLVLGVFTSIPFAFAVKYDLSIPNFVYVIFISMGVVVSYGLGIFELWMTIFYFVVLLLGLFMKYSDNLRTIAVRGDIIPKISKPSPVVNKGGAFLEGKKDWKYLINSSSRNEGILTGRRERLTNTSIRKSKLIKSSDVMNKVLPETERKRLTSSATEFLKVSSKNVKDMTSSSLGATRFKVDRLSGRKLFKENGDYYVSTLPVGEYNLKGAIKRWKKK